MQNVPEIMRRALSMELGYKRTEEEKIRDMVDTFNATNGTLDAEEYDCKLCLNKGLVMRPVNRGTYWDTVSTPCKCLKTRETIRNMKKSGLQNIIRDCTFSKFIATEPWQVKMKEAAIEYAKNPEGWFFIGGQTGAGKTHICSAICRELLLSGKKVKYMMWREEAVKLKGAVNDPDKYSEMMEDLKKADVLYIDDLFKTGKTDSGNKQRPTAADVNIAFEILNHRYLNPNLFTIISSESTINDLMDIDEALSGRIYERANVLSISPDMKKNFRMKGVIEL